ncbi:MAG: Rieske (2Fe-2S) protein [Myxococcaceae bacterium]
MAFHPVLREDELPSGDRRTVKIAGRDVALFHLGDGYYAIDNTCPHRGGPLGEGDLNGHLIHCPLHAWCFDLRTGNSPVYTMARVMTFEVRVREGMIEVSDEGRLPPFPEIS